MIVHRTKIESSGEINNEKSKIKVKENRKQKEIHF